MKIIIIEDEILLADDLQLMLSELRPDWTVSARIQSVAEGLRFFSRTDQYDLIFSDIQLGDGLSFDIFSQHKAAAPVIFCTAYNQYALEAFRNNGIEYLLKPFDTAAVLEAIRHVETLKGQLLKTDFNHLLPAFQAPPPQPSGSGSLLIRYQDKIIPLAPAQVALCYLKDGQVRVMDLNSKTYPVPQTLDELEHQLGAAFYRADRQHLVQRKTIRDVSHYFDRKLSLNLSVDYPDKILIRKEKTPHFLNWLSEQS